MKLDEIIENEIQRFVDNLDCYELSDIVSAEILKISNDSQDIHDCITAVYPLYILPPADLDGYIQISELEVPVDMIEQDELDDVTINGDYAYISIGYGIGFDVDRKKLKELSE